MATQPYLPDYVDQDNDRPHLAIGAPFVVLSRYIGWVALSVWLGAITAAAYITPPATIAALSFVPVWHHPEWRSRTAMYIFWNVADRTLAVSAVCAILLIGSTLQEGFRSSAKRWIAFLPFVATLGAGICLLKCAQLHYMMYGGATFRMAYAQYPQWALAEIITLAAAALLIVWLQTAYAGSQRAE